MIHPESLLFVTLDSCRYDTFVAAEAPHLKSVGKVYQAMAPATFTYGSHAAMFVGFTPGVAEMREPFVNPKFARIFRLAGSAQSSSGTPFANLSGRNVIEGYKRLGFFTIGTGAVNWFNPRTETAQVLIRDFDRYFYAGHDVRRQVEFVMDRLAASPTAKVLVFMNIGETHVPYYHAGADWPAAENPCLPFGVNNDAAKCRERQLACLEYIDGQLAGLIDLFAEANTLVCADHGDAWGEGGVWEHGIHHQKVLEVPLLFRLANPPAQPVSPSRGVLSRTVVKFPWLRSLRQRLAVLA